VRSYRQRNPVGERPAASSYLIRPYGTLAETLSERQTIVDNICDMYSDLAGNLGVSSDHPACRSANVRNLLKFPTEFSSPAEPPQSNFGKSAIGMGRSVPFPSPVATNSNPHHRRRRR
jgi:hypothetical protein